jgi:hypothetical protein
MITCFRPVADGWDNRGICVASITYHFVEVPGIQLGAAVINRSRRAAGNVAPATVQVAVA